MTHPMQFRRRLLCRMFPRMSSLLKFKPFVRTRRDPPATDEPEPAETTFEKWLTECASEGETAFLRDWLALSVQGHDTNSADTNRKDWGQRRDFVPTQPPNETRPTDLKKEPMKLSL
uniref:Uncharacterized protein n=1 Tax=Noctiluca scintillans TaxID=2966 RepID=A0A7S1AQU1_NOCSC